MVTQSEFDQFEDLMRKVVREETAHLPSKDKFYEETLKILDELQEIRDDNKILNNQTKDYDDRLEKLEKLHPQGHHAVI